MQAWWAEPIGGRPPRGDGRASGSQFAWLPFGAHGITPIGYAAFAFALGARPAP